MRKLFYLGKSLLTVLLSALLFVFAFVLLHAPVFETGERYTFYLGANSSARAVVSEFPLLDKLLLSPSAESVRYEGNQYERLKERFRAELLFTESAAGVTNYYLRSPLLKECVLIGSRAVNLHIAVDGSATVAGTPLIFGGF